MTIGFVVSFFDFRNDVRKVIEILSSDNKVIVFYKSADEEKVLNHRLPKVEYRPVTERKKTIGNLITERLYFYFKKLPKSRNNYFLMELFKISNMKSLKAKRRANFVFKTQQLLPRLISYDRYLKWLQPACKTDLTDIDRFILFTEIADDYLLTRVIREKKDVITYVYSWDHPCKHTRFSKKINYVCWSEGIRNDMIKLQGIDASKLKSIGASQFGYLFEFLNNKTTILQKTFPFEYIYFGCAIGIKELVRDEIEVIKKLARITLQKTPNLKFVVRPYPVLDEWSLYDDLKKIPNVVLDDSFRKKDFSVSEEDIYAKFEKIQNAKAFLHLGTTLGLEACFISKPSFIVDFDFGKKGGLSLHTFIHQYQNEKYLVNASQKNTLKNPDDFVHFLESENEDEYLRLNAKIQKEFPVYSFNQFSKNIVA